MALRDAEEPIWNLSEPEGGWGWLIRALDELMEGGLVEKGAKQWTGASQHHDIASKAITELGADCFRLTSAGQVEAAKIKS